jgi:hypothetical protein
LRSSSSSPENDAQILGKAANKPDFGSNALRVAQIKEAGENLCEEWGDRPNPDLFK